MDVVKATHETTFEVTDLPAGPRRRHRALTEAGLAGEKRIKPARSGVRSTAPWLAHVRPVPRGSDPEAPADHVVTLGRTIEVEGWRHTIEKNTAADNCRLVPFS